MKYASTIAANVQPILRKLLLASCAAALCGGLGAEEGRVVLADAGKAGKYDMTSSLKFLCAPNKSVSYWSSFLARAMTTIYPYGGRLWTSGGDWYGNTGSAPIFSIDPETGAFARDYVAGTETVWYFREGSDGSLYVPGVDQNERDNDYDQGGAYFWRRNDGTWVKYLSNSNQTDRILRVPFGSIPQSAYTSSPSYEGMLMHTFDLVNWKGRTFVCGYGIAWGEEGGYECMSNATPNVTTETRALSSPDGWQTFIQWRFTSFLPFEDNLYCFTETRLSSSSGYDYPFQQWRFNEATGLFDAEDVPRDNIAPDVGSADDLPWPYRPVMLWHPTPFGNRVLYIVGVEGASCCPWILCSAIDDGGYVKATKIDLGEGVYPFCITKHDGKVTVVAGQNDASDGMVVNSVWESSNGLNFRRIFSFKSSRQAAAVACVGGTYYFGMGYGGYCPPAWTLSGDDTAGNIYKVVFDHEYTPVSLSPAIAAVKDNGNSARISVRVTCLDADSASLSLVFGGTVVTNWENVVEGETYFATLDTVPGREYAFSFVATPSDGSVAAAAGTFVASAVDGWFAVSFSDPGYKAGAGWADVTEVSNPGGAWTMGGMDESVLLEASATAPRHVRFDGAGEIAFTPTSPSANGDDVLVSGRISITAALTLPAADAGQKASLFFCETNDEIRACGYANGAWTVFDRTSAALESGTWADYAVEIDQTSSAAPRIQYRLGEEILRAASCPDGWIPLASAPGSVSVVAYRGTGGIGDFSGETRAKVIATFPVPVIGGGDGGAGGSGLAFGTNAATGSKTFTATVSNPVAGAYYTAFTATNLVGTFRAECVVRAGDGDSVIPLEVDATPASKFVKIVVSATPFSIGDPLPKEEP